MMKQSWLALNYTSLSEYEFVGRSISELRVATEQLGDDKLHSILEYFDCYT